MIAPQIRSEANANSSIYDGRCGTATRVFWNSYAPPFLTAYRFEVNSFQSAILIIRWQSTNVKLRLVTSLGVLACMVAITALARPSDEPEQRASIVPISSAVGLIPLDSRPATALLPIRIAAVGGLEVVSPSQKLLGEAKRGADLEAIQDWLWTANPRALVVSLDALAYGGLVQSRSSTISSQDAWDRLLMLRRWKLVTKRPIFASITIPRSPDAKDRPRNLELIRKAIQWAEEGTLERLYVTWDDALPGSPAPTEGAKIAAEVEARGLRNVLVYPGADEVTGSLISSFALNERQIRPKVRLEFSDPKARMEIIKYDGLPLEDSAERQANAAGLEVVTDGSEAFTLYIYNGGNPRTAAVRLSVLQRRAPTAFVDVANVNKASSLLVNDVVVLKRFMKLWAFAAWGTPGNNLGTAFAQAGLRSTEPESAASLELLVHQYLNDFIYSSLLRDAIRIRWQESDLGSDAAQSDLLERVRALFVSSRLSSKDCYQIADAKFPWNRSFEGQIDLEVKTDGARDCVSSTTR
jgi:Protein of unknown function (DUF4127)